MQARERAGRSWWRSEGVAAGLVAAVILGGAPTVAVGGGPSPVVGDPGMDEAEVRAMDLEAQGDLRGAAKLWQSLAVTGRDEEVRLGAAFRAQRARRALGVTTGALAEFCAAERIIAGVLAWEELPAQVRADFELFAEEVAAEVAALEGRCGDFEAVPEEVAPSAGVVAAEPSTVADVASSTVGTARPGRGFVLAGAVVGSVGLACMGVMSYGLVVDHAAADEVFALADKNHAVGLTAAEIVELDQAIERGRAGARVALAGGIAGGALLVASVGLLAHGGRVARAQRVALSPSLRLGDGLVGVSLGGRF